MEIAVVLNVHSQPDVIIDTLDSILTYVTDKVLVVVDGASWDDFRDVKLPVGKVQGFYHNKPKSPYRNVALALNTVTDTYKQADWFCYCEADVLFGSERFKHNLKMAEDMGVWMLGNDGHVDNMAMPLVSALIGEPIKSCYYLLGCCQFFHRKFIDKLKEINFFDKFLHMTNGFTEGYFPMYSGYDLSEHMYPTLCRHYGGNVGVFATYDHDGSWHGASEYFPCRWKPELDPETETFPNASIMHPLKKYDHPVREYHREKRNKWKASQTKERQSESSLTCPSDTNRTDADSSTP